MFFCKTSDADAGKELRIELRTNTKQYSGVVNTVYCGDKIDIWEFLFTQYGIETITAFFPVVCKCDNHYLQYHARTYLSYQIRHGISWMVHAYGINLDAR